MINLYYPHVDQCSYPNILRNVLEPICGRMKILAERTVYANMQFISI